MRSIQKNTENYIYFLIKDPLGVINMENLYLKV